MEKEDIKKPLGDTDEKTPILNQQPQGSLPPATANGEDFAVHTPKPKSYLIPALLVTVCCFWPLGFVAVYKEIQARNLHRMGQYQAARTASNEARRFTALGCAVGCISHALIWTLIIVVNGIIFGVLGAVGAFDSHNSTEVSEYY